MTSRFCANCGAKVDAVQSSTVCYHFVVMGAGGVGKSAVTLQFINRQFLSLYDPTIEDRYQKQIEYKNIQCMLEILDTAGQETFSAMRELYMANGEGFALVYSIISNLSFTEIEKIRNGIIKHKNSTQVPMVLVGNKLDLEAKREVPTEKAKQITKEWGCEFIEASAKTDTNIRQIFFSLIDQVWLLNGQPKLTKDRKYLQCSLL